jgi:hypothetical protein
MKFCANKIYNDKSLVSDNVDGKLRIIAANIAIPICLVFNLSLRESVCPQASQGLCMRMTQHCTRQLQQLK